jgi:hypothetical protein
MSLVPAKIKRHSEGLHTDLVVKGVIRTGSKHDCLGDGCCGADKAETSSGSAQYVVHCQ